MDIGAWLRSLGLERYERAFRDNAIDADVLPELTEEHLKELGLPLGHRLKLLKAIAARRGDPPPMAVGADEPLTAAPAAAPAPAQAERRQLTVMFCDLVGSTALAARLDPEDLRAVIGAYHRCCAEAIGRFEGHVAKYLGDGVLAYFGYPQAHEDDAERAVRAGLALVEAVGKLSPRENLALQVRVGIATGVVVAGDLIGEGAAREEAVVGETPNLAARLQALADPGTVVIAPGTRRLVGGVFDLADLGPRHLKGFAAPLRAWRVLGPSGAEGRFEARQGAGVTALVGREHELGLLLERWRLAKDGEGQAVLLVGEPGIGKSRLVRALRDRLAGEPHTPLRYQGSPYHTQSALHPIIDQLERAADLQRDDPAATRLAKLEALLAEGTDDVAAVAPLVAGLLSIPTEGRYAALNLTPQRRKERLFAALLDQLRGLAARRPVLDVVEDAHWLDPTTAELIELAVERARGLPVLLVVTARPGFTPGWAHHAHVTVLTLNRLGRRQAAALVERVTGGAALPAAVLEQILAKTDGVPLFVEELTKAVLESGLVRAAGDRYERAGALAPLAIPASLHDSLMARLDRLGPAKEVAQVAAVVGREFAHELLASVAPVDGARLRDALDQLVASELLFRRGVPPEASYVFKHALVRDAAYQSLLRSRRQQLHAQIARVLEEQFPEAEPERLARHFTEAGFVEKAVGYWLRAGQRARERFANVEAIAHFNRGIEVLADLPGTAERARWELELRAALGATLLMARGHSAPEVADTYLRVRDLCKRLGDHQHLLPALVGLCRACAVQGEYQKAIEYGEELLRLGEQTGEPAFLVAGHYGVGLQLLHLANVAGAREHLNRGATLDDPRQHRSLSSYTAHPPGLACVAFGALPLWLLGYPDQAVSRTRHALKLARELAHPYSSVFTLRTAATLYQYRREAGATRELAEEAIVLATEQGFPFWLPFVTIFRSWALAQEGRRTEALTLAREGWASWQARGSEMFGPYFRCLVGEVYASAGEFEGAMKMLADAFALADRTGERSWEAELHRVRGEVLLAAQASQSDKAESCFLNALANARRQEARSLELRAATSLARLRRDQGRPTKARDLLAPVYGWFTEGFDTPDLKDAQALLDELS